MTEVGYDLILKGGWVIDPGQGLNGPFDVAVRGDRIAAVEPTLEAVPNAELIDVSGKLVVPGLIDLHVHVFEHTTDFGLPPDDAGIHSGVTTGVDQGSAGAWTFYPFKAHIIDKATTEILSFISINLAGPLRGCKGGPVIQSLQFIDVDVLCRFHEQFPHLIRGIKGHGESGSWSMWGSRMLELAREAADRTKLPLYVHTGQLWPVDERNRPAPESVMPDVLRLVRPGDILAHAYSSRPDGILGTRQKPAPELVEAVKSGVHLDIGHGVNFSFETARRMMGAGLFPYTISSDVHGDFYTHHNDSTLDYSLLGTMAKLLALGMDLEDVIAAVTINPARILRMADEIGTLKPGSRADITVLDRVEGDWDLVDAHKERLKARQRLLPATVVRAGRALTPNCRLLRDLTQPLPTA